MPGAKLSMKVASVGDRGLRSPRHLGGVFGHGDTSLHPWMCAPVRPGETFVGASLQGETWLNSVINAVQAPMMWAEVGLWYIPLTAYGDWMVRLLTATADDIEDSTGGTFSSQGSIGFADNADEQGLQTFHRPWAGETGLSPGGGDLGAAYVPLVSRGTYKVAEDWYGLNNYNAVGNVSRYDNPPNLDQYVTGAASKRIDLQGAADPDPSGALSLATLMDQLSLLTKTEVSYAEYLAAHGVNPRHSDGISMPLMTAHAALSAQDDPIFASGVQGEVNNASDPDSYERTVGAGQFASTVTTDLNSGFVYNHRPMSSYRNIWNTFRTKAVTFDAPGVILGTVVFYSEPLGQSDGGAYMDAVRLVQGGHWGDRSFGGIEETDFMMVNDYFNREGVQEDQSLWNMLNLYVNGDTFGYGDIGAGNPFAFRDPSGRGILPGFHIEATSKFSAQLHILSDMIG